MTRKKITMYGTEEQKEQIEQRAQQCGVSVSEYCLEAVEQRIARELQQKRMSDIGVENRIDEINEELNNRADRIFGGSTDQEQLYGIALWELLSGEFSRETRKESMKSASNKLDKGIKKLQKKDGEVQ
ncbi:plasmid mobilization protein [Haloarcula halophila]|jgi:hypothetical protein|uniref:plasmid mobilization protein n=1 Tax=Haloarcula TaxID=2237 RepID=UPI0023E3F11D|nr:hypothetical protein [Halomicroarcula sp. DFY41]